MLIVGPIITAIVLLCASIGAAQVVEHTETMAGMSVTVWSQHSYVAAKQPVIIFSHGFHGCAIQSRFLMEAFASAGYLVFAPNHRDAVCHGGQASLFGRPEVPFRKPEQWDETTFRDRGEDIRRLIDVLRADVRYSEADWSRLGLAGHSLGGYTALALAGAWPGWKMPGVSAVLAMSPYVRPFIVYGTLKNVSAPVMYQGGTWDPGVTPAVRKPGGGYDLTPPPKYYVEFNRANHLSWTGLPIFRKAHSHMISYGLAFMDHYVKGEPARPLLTCAVPGVARFRYVSELGNDEDQEGGAARHDGD